MNLSDVINFLNLRKGYKKKGARRLSQEVLKGKADVETCRLALKFVNKIDSAKAPKLSKKEKEATKVLIYDIETSYNIVSTWRIGNKVSLPHYSIIKERAIICVSYKWLGEDEVYTLTWDKDQDDKFLLEQFIEVMNEADVLVAHNGDRFDIKWIKTRALKHDLEMLPVYNTIDTLWLAKKHFYLNSNKLDYISKFLGFEGKIKTEPELWDKIILEKDNKALRDMVTYCIEDVRQLEKVYNKLKVWDKPKQHAGMLLLDDKACSPISASKDLELVKTLSTAGGTKKRIMRDLSTDRLFEMSDVNYKKWLNE